MTTRSRIHVIRCEGCEAIHIAGDVVCPNCGRCPNCGVRRLKKNQIPQECSECGATFCVSCSRCHQCGSVRDFGIEVCHCGYPDNLEAVESIAKAFHYPPPPYVFKPMDIVYSILGILLGLSAIGVVLGVIWSLVKIIQRII